MATDDESMKQEVRALTDYDTNVMSDPELQGVLDIAERELLANLNSPTINPYTDINTERALFWLTCVFVKIKAGEIQAPSFEIGELQVNADGIGGRHGIWLENFWNHFRSAEGGSPVGHIKTNRSNRTYNFDNSNVNE